MRIIDEDGVEITDPDFSKGYCVEDSIIIAHHPAQEYIPEQWHYEVAREYPTGGKDVVRVIDIPGQEAKGAWDEVENILRWFWYKEPVPPPPEPTSPPPAERNVSKGEYFTADGALYLALSGIPVGAEILDGINCIETSVTDVLNGISQQEE